MRIYLRKDGSRTIHHVNYKEIDKIGGIRDLNVLDYYNNYDNHLITIEKNGDILYYEEYKTWKEFEKIYGQYDVYHNKQAINFLKLNGYLI